MNRQVTTTFLFCLFAACAAPTESALKRIPEKPNIVLVVIDDMGWTDLGSFGSAPNAALAYARHLGNEGSATEAGTEAMG